MEEYTRVQHHAHGRDITETLTDQIPVSGKFLQFVKNFTNLLAQPKNYTFSTTSFHPQAQTKIVIATDVSPDKTG